MKLKENYTLQQLADTWVVLALGEETLNFTGMLTLNETGKVLWEALEAGGDKEALVKALTSEYRVTEEQAAEDVEAFLKSLSDYGCLSL